MCFSIIYFSIIFILFLTNQTELLESDQVDLCNNNYDQSALVNFSTEAHETPIRVPEVHGKRKMLGIFEIFGRVRTDLGSFGKFKTSKKISATLLNCQEIRVLRG